MKIIKLFLVVLTIVAICFTVIKLTPEQGIIDGKDIAQFENEDEKKRISQKINILGNLSAFSFQKESYDKINFEIENFIDDSNTKEKLQQMAYTVYTNNFIRNSKNVFGGQTWENNDVSFIRSEVEELMILSFLDTSSLMKRELSEIKNCINDYDKIKSFISFKSFTSNSSGETSLLLDKKFPFSRLKIKISEVEIFRSLVNNSPYLKNNIQLSKGLNIIKRNGIILYEDHVENKILEHRESYKEWAPENKYDDFDSIIINPLKSVIITFKDNCRVNGYDYNYDRIKNVEDNLSQMIGHAYDYFSNN